MSVLFSEIELASIAGWEGSQARDFCGLPASKPADDLGHDVIELIGRGGGCDPGGASEAAN